MTSIKAVIEVTDGSVSVKVDGDGANKDVLVLLGALEKLKSEILARMREEDQGAGKEFGDFSPKMRKGGR